MFFVFLLLFSLLLYRIRRLDAPQTMAEVAAIPPPIIVRNVVLRWCPVPPPPMLHLRPPSFPAAVAMAVRVVSNGPRTHHHHLVAIRRVERSAPSVTRIRSIRCSTVVVTCVCVTIVPSNSGGVWAAVNVLSVEQ